MDNRKSPPSPTTFLKHVKAVPTHTYCFYPHEKPGKPISKAGSKALQTSGEAAILSLPVITKAGIDMLGDTGRYSLAPLGVPVTIGGIVLDTLKAPFCIAVATEEAVRGGILKLVSLLFEASPVELEIKRIFKSFLLRMQQTATILIALGLEESDVLDAKLRSGDIEDLVGLTLLHTAYASHHYEEGLLLASNKILKREDCPRDGLRLFDIIMDLKKSINEAFRLAIPHLANLHSEERELEESRVVCQWIMQIKAGKILSQADEPDATEGHLNIVNAIISQVEQLKKRGMKELPESPNYVVKHMRK